MALNVSCKENVPSKDGEWRETPETEVKAPCSDDNDPIIPESTRLPIGTTVKKYFPNYGYFEGTISSYEGEGRYYRVKYEDGDQEDLDHHEALALLKKSCNRQKSSNRQAAKSSRQKRRRQDNLQTASGKVQSPSTDSLIDNEYVSADSKRSMSTDRRPKGRGPNLPASASLRPRRNAALKKAVVEWQSDEDDTPESEVSGDEVELESDAESSEPSVAFEEDSVEEIPIRKKRRTVIGDKLNPQVPSSTECSEHLHIYVPKNQINVQWKNASPSKKFAHPARTKAANVSKHEAEKCKDTDSVVSFDVRRILKAPYTGGDGLEIIVDPPKMFDDMIQKKLPNQKDLLLPMLQSFRNRTLRVATMCSGTESPILALDMLQKSIQEYCLEHLTAEVMQMGLDHERLFQIEHVFSCEIEPFKQAYIERNFHPPILFRDIRELGQEEAFTAYGALVKVPNTPGCVDMLVAGTSCVDYSNLNNRKKEINDAGESGQTFWGMIDWIDKAQPPIIIIENVSGAPWDLKVKIFEERGYAATFQRLDTKDYYIPHTRQRGYLFAVKKTFNNATDSRASDWVKLLKDLKRPASASLDAFMLANDDPRVLRGRARITSESCLGDHDARGDRAGRTDWTKCETRHQFARSQEELGEKRPLTGWSDSGSTTMPSFAWNEWADAQVHRIHDLMDINTLRLAKVGMDCTYKTMVWNLSQNVDRDTMGKLGLCQCLTPTGVPYVTSRGGPLVGEELLLLQGIPADDLLLTKESEDNLKDLAGNAMSTTVVGAAILCALIHGHRSLSRREETSHSFVGKVVHSLVPRPLLPPCDIELTEKYGKYGTTVLHLGPTPINGLSQWNQLLAAAASSARKCVNEGPEEAIPTESIVICSECGQTSSVDSAFPPRKYEEHNFRKLHESSRRVLPSDFRQSLLQYVPMRVQIKFDFGALHRPHVIDTSLWDSWLESLMKTVGVVEGLVDYDFAYTIRSARWIARYFSESEGHLDLYIGSGSVTWYLFAKLPERNSQLRDILQRPIARMTVDAPDGWHSMTTMTSGKWEVCLPLFEPINILVEGEGTLIPSWRSRLGLRQFESEKQFERLKVSIPGNVPSSLKKLVEGQYKLLPKCGGPCGSLRQKVDNSSTKVYMCLDSGRKSHPDNDSFIFASSFHRVACEEYREIHLCVDPKLRYRDHGFFNEGERYCKEIQAITLGKWHSLAGSMLLVPTISSTVTMPISGETVLVPVHAGAYQTAPLLVSCGFFVRDDGSIARHCKRYKGSTDLNLPKSKQVLHHVAFVTSRIPIPNIFPNMGWVELDRSHVVTLEGEDEISERCSPRKPYTKWMSVTKGKRTTFVPIEDGKEAAFYEKALKERPNPWIVRFSLGSATSIPGSTSVNMMVGCNPASLAHRGLGMFPKRSMQRIALLDVVETSGDSNLGHCCFEWRVLPHVEKSKVEFPKLTFKSNKSDEHTSQPPRFQKFKLRREQLRSLHWMLQQEAVTTPFFEEEVIEAVLPSFKWRLECRVRRPVLVRGGIIADEVGYGKTAITLGLIDSAETVNGPPPSPPIGLRGGFLLTKATLVIVPGHLMGQWPEEVKKFLGSSKRIYIINDMSSFNKLTAEDLQNADIVLVNFTVLSGEKYFARLARLSGVNPKSMPAGKDGGRHFHAVYDECLNRLAARVCHIQSDPKTVYDAIEQDARHYLNIQSGEKIVLDGKKTIYKNGTDACYNRTEKLDSFEKDPWGFTTLKVKRFYKKMRCPPLEMFYWNRVVVDEFTYLCDKSREKVFDLVLKLRCSFRWCLSGTPKHANFNDIQILSNLLGVHLGTEEALPGTRVTKRHLSTKESTGLESLSHFLEVRSLQWHERRHSLAQEFLDRFVRQNIAEIDEIPSEDHVIDVALPPAERAIYLELETHLKSLEMNNRNALKSKKNTSGDRDKRMQKALCGSDSAEEALLKCCSHFNLSSETTSALETIDDIIKFREREKLDLEREIVSHLLTAYQQRQKIQSYQPDWGPTTRTEKGEIHDALDIYLKAVDDKDSVTHGADDEINERIRGLVQNALDLFERSQTAEITWPQGSDRGADGGKRKRQKVGKYESEVDEEKLYALKQSLRNHMHGVRSLGKELCGRTRSLRYIEWIRRFQTRSCGFSCMGCKETGLERSRMGVLSSCGHSGCIRCLQLAAGEGKCVESPSCSARVSAAHIVSADNLGLDREETGTDRFGCKLTAVVDKVKEIIGSGDRVIVFCQFDDLKDKVRDCLSSHGIESLQVQGNINKQIRDLSVFQKETPDAKDPRVLMLKMDDEQSAGLNLTNLNHAVFVHPLLAHSQQEYDAYETQAIGRIRRFGQTKTVHVWRFLANDTIDTEIFNERGGRLITNTTNTKH